MAPCTRRSCSPEPRAHGTAVVGDALTDTRLQGQPAGHAIRSFVLMPRHRAGRRTAAFAVTGPAPRTWREDQVKLIEDVGGPSSSAAACASSSGRPTGRS